MDGFPSARRSASLMERPSNPVTVKLGARSPTARPTAGAGMATSAEAAGCSATAGGWMGATPGSGPEGACAAAPPAVVAGRRVGDAQPTTTRATTPRASRYRADVQGRAKRHSPRMNHTPRDGLSDWRARKPRRNLGGSTAEKPEQRRVSSSEKRRRCATPGPRSSGGAPRRGRSAAPAQGDGASSAWKPLACR